MASVILALSTPGALGCRTEFVTPVDIAWVIADPDAARSAFDDDDTDDGVACER